MRNWAWDRRISSHGCRNFSSSRGDYCNFNLKIRTLEFYRKTIKITDCSFRFSRVKWKITPIFYLNLFIKKGELVFQEMLYCSFSTKIDEKEFTVAFLLASNFQSKIYRRCESDRQIGVCLHEADPHRPETHQPALFGYQSRHQQLPEGQRPDERHEFASQVRRRIHFWSHVVNILVFFFILLLINGSGN